MIILPSIARSVASAHAHTSHRPLSTRTGRHTVKRAGERNWIVLALATDQKAELMNNRVIYSIFFFTPFTHHDHSKMTVPYTYSICLRHTCVCDAMMNEPRTRFASNTFRAWKLWSGHTIELEEIFRDNEKKKVILMIFRTMLTWTECEMPFTSCWRWRAGYNRAPNNAH